MNANFPSAIVKVDKSEIISHFSSLTQVVDIDGLTDAVLFTYMRAGLRLSVQILSPFCQSFIERFKKAKKEKQDFHGFTDFNRAAERLTGYSGRQVRNLAAGTPTPPKKAVANRLTEAEKITRDETRKLQEEQDIAEAQRQAARNRSNAESQAAQKKTVSPVSAISVVRISQQEVNELKDFKKIHSSEVQALETEITKLKGSVQKLTVAYEALRSDAVRLATAGTKVTNAKSLVARAQTFLKKHGETVAD
ncbi:MAG: hypothetical protein WCA19_07155 [Candidatus Acidiferrales bacterium]